MTVPSTCLLGFPNTVFLCILQESQPLACYYEDPHTKKGYRLIPVTLTAFPSNDADLAGLTLFSATMSFDSATANYELSVANLVSSLTVTPTTADSAATATLSVYDNTNTKVINAVSVSSGQASGPVLLSVGSNKIDVEVTAQNGS